MKNCSKSTSAIHAYQKKRCHACPGYINYHMKSEVSITLRCRLCSTCYTAVRIKNCLQSTSAIKIATMTNTDDFRSYFRYHRYYTNNTGLEAPLHVLALLVVPKVINLPVASCLQLCHYLRCYALLSQDGIWLLFHEL